MNVTDGRRRQEPRRVGLLDLLELLGAGVARAEDGRARRGLRGQGRLVHALRVGPRGGAERARDAERVGGFCRLCRFCVSFLSMPNPFGPLGLISWLANPRGWASWR